MFAISGVSADRQQSTFDVMAERFVQWGVMATATSFLVVAIGRWIDNMAQDIVGWLYNDRLELGGRMLQLYLVVAVTGTIATAIMDAYRLFAGRKPLKDADAPGIVGFWVGTWLGLFLFDVVIRVLPQIFLYD